MRSRFTAPLLVVLALPSLAHADDDDCTDDISTVAGGTGTTQIAEMFAACEAAMQAAAPGSTEIPAACNGKTDGPPRGPTGTFHAATLAVGVEGRSDDGAGQAAGWMTGDAGVRGGWHRGIQGCVHGHVAAGATTRVDSSWSVVFPFWFTGIGLAFDQSYDARPSLSTSRIWLRRDYTYDRMHAAMSIASWANGGSGASAVIPVEITTGWREQPDGTRERATQQTLHLAAYERTGDVRVELARFEEQLIYPDGIPPDGVSAAAVGKRPPLEVGRFDPLDLGLPLGGGVRGEAAAGWTWASVPLRCEGCAGVAGTFGLTGGAAGGTWNLRAERAASLALDARVVVEDRVTIGYAHPHRHGSYRIGAWSALTRTTAADETHVVATGGGEASVDWRVAPRLVMSVDAEAGRSYYARLDGDPAPVAEPGARVGIRLEERFGRKH